MVPDVQTEMFDDNPAYEAFEEKFKPKKTTDDCYTPENIYDTVAEWVREEYGVARERMVRPFWPGGDYERFDYPDGCVVVDNPPFSILASIYRFYLRRGIKFFLFGPTLTLFSGRIEGICWIPCGVKVTYANGANVNTSFATNLDGLLVRSAPELYRRVSIVNDANEKEKTKTLPKYIYPDHVLTAAAAYQYSHYGVEYRLERKDAVFIRHLDAQKAFGKSVFGGGYLLSSNAAAERAAAERAAAERAAAERAAAERAAARVWELSAREKRIVQGLGSDGTEAESLPAEAEASDGQLPGQISMF